MKKIFEPVEMKGLTARNRLVRSATWEGIANPDGSVTEEAYEIYRELAKGGIGAIITGFTSVALHDYYFDGMMRLCDDALIPQYRKLADVIHAENCPVITQLALGAYYREVNGRYRKAEPDEMTEDEIALRPEAPPLSCPTGWRMIWPCATLTRRLPLSWRRRTPTGCWSSWTTTSGVRFRWLI